MSIAKTLGGDRLGSGKRMKVHMHNYERSTHDLGYLFRTTMSAGTLVPFLSEVALPGDTFDINLDAKVLTHPTVGPLFGSFKVQLDVFQCPIRLYNSKLHNNALGIGMKMSDIKLPILKFDVQALGDPLSVQDLDNVHVNSSSSIKYLGVGGFGISQENTVREFNGVPLLAYWEIYKQYYSNKQEEIGAVIHTPADTNIQTITEVRIRQDAGGAANTLPQAPVSSGPYDLKNLTEIEIEFVGQEPDPRQVILNTSLGLYSAQELCGSFVRVNNYLVGVYRFDVLGYTVTNNWRYRNSNDIGSGMPGIKTFPLKNIDVMREKILAANGNVPFDIKAQNLEPYSLLFEESDDSRSLTFSQEGLGLKTYQSDIFNNWLSTDWIDGAGGISEITAVDTSSGSFTIDALGLARKVYNMLNRIAVSGGTYDDWLDAVYTHDRYIRSESPIYHGGLIKELVFQEVISNAEATADQGTQPLGTLAGRGLLSNKHKGGYVVVKVDEPSYIIGIVSLTPRLDYSQGNKWDMHLKTIDDFHKPALDQIGFQELLVENMAWWDTYYENGNWVKKSAGKQPAWINYMTNHNRVYGNFATPSENFMVLNRRYEYGDLEKGVKDLTTYIDPEKFNRIFAQTSLDAQNFWTQIAVDITARRKMSAKVMPNL